MFTSSELVTLAEAYCAAENKSLAALGDAIFENHKFFKLLAAGKGAHIHNAEKAAVWFCENWPKHAAWPKDVSRPKTVRRPAEAA